MTEKLKPCPFCKRKIGLYVFSDKISPNLHSVICTKCLAQGPLVYSENTKEIIKKARAAWNERV